MATFGERSPDGRTGPSLGPHGGLPGLAPRGGEAQKPWWGDPRARAQPLVRRAEGMPLAWTAPWYAPPRDDRGEPARGAARLARAHRWGLDADDDVELLPDLPVFTDFLERAESSSLKIPFLIHIFKFSNLGKTCKIGIGFLCFQ